MCVHIHIHMQVMLSLDTVQLRTAHTRGAVHHNTPTPAVLIFMAGSQIDIECVKLR